MKNMAIYLLIILIIIIIIVAAMGLAGYLLYRKIKKAASSVFGSKYLREGLRAQAEHLEKTPKSVAGMTKIYLPQIQEDFPGFNWQEFRYKTENMLKAFLTAIDTEDEKKLKDASLELEKQLKLHLEDNKRQNVRERYRNIQVHQTEITKYQKQAGTCAITIQSAVGYYHYIEDLQGKVISGMKDRKEQTRYNAELVYIQDMSKAESAGIGLVCPNCGAPITNLGSKYCEYCKTGIREINVLVWSLNKIYQV